MALITIQAIIRARPEFNTHCVFTSDAISWFVTKLEGILSTVEEDCVAFIIPARKPFRGFVNAHEMADPKDTLHKECFLTIGATANFTDLLKQAVTEEVISALKDQGFTDLTLQVGNSHTYFTKIKPEETAGINIEYFDFNPHGLTYEMKKCQAKEGVSKEGLVISHAGSGTILDAMRLNLPLIVVPNVSLLDNHQEELAAELEKQGYVVKSSVEGLATAIKKATKIARKGWGTQNALAALGHITSTSQIMDTVSGHREREEETQRLLD